MIKPVDWLEDRIETLEVALVLLRDDGNGYEKLLRQYRHLINVLRHEMEEFQAEEVHGRGPHGGGGVSCD